MKKVIPYIMFPSNAEEAMMYYTTVIKDSEIINIQRYGKGEASAEGSVRLAVFRIKDQQFMCSDSAMEPKIGLSPALSVYLICESEREIKDVYTSFAIEGKVLMPLDDYGTGKLFAWIMDPFGLSWQIKLA